MTDPDDVIEIKLKLREITTLLTQDKETRARLDAIMEEKLKDLEHMVRRPEKGLMFKVRDLELIEERRTRQMKMVWGAIITGLVGMGYSILKGALAIS